MASGLQRRMIMASACNVCYHEDCAPLTSKAFLFMMPIWCLYCPLLELQQRRLFIRTLMTKMVGCSFSVKPISILLSEAPSSRGYDSQHFFSSMFR